MILGANGIYFLIMTIFGFTYQKTEIAMFLLVLVIYVGSFQFLFRLGSPRTSEPDGKGQLLDPGLDLVIFLVFLVKFRIFEAVFLIKWQE